MIMPHLKIAEHKYGECFFQVVLIRLIFQYIKDIGYNRRNPYQIIDRVDAKNNE
jgi:hypothetical protein